MADRRVATHQHHVTGEGALTIELAGSILCEN
jgi:hypothetical protein